MRPCLGTAAGPLWLLAHMADYTASFTTGFVAGYPAGYIAGKVLTVWSVPFALSAIYISRFKFVGRMAEFDVSPSLSLSRVTPNVAFLTH